MKAKFRIKEVVLPINGATITVFYPQIEVTVIGYTGFFWWKKIIETKNWRCLYREKGEGKLKGKLFYDEFSTTEIVQCDSEGGAKAVIDELIKQSNQVIEERYRTTAHKWTDERYVKIHEVTI